MGILFGMDYWHEIVRSYDDPMSKDPRKKNDGTYYQSSVVILLIYLTFGDDYPYHIAKYFNRLPRRPDKTTPYRSVLKNSKVGTLLNKMKEDELVTVTNQVVKSRPRKTYSINPRIIQSPKRTHLKRVGSTFEISTEMVERFLLWSKECNEEDESRDRTFKNTISPDIVDYYTFLFFLESEAARWHLWMALEHDPFARKWDPTLNKLVSEYIKELKELANSNFDPYMEHRLRTMPHDFAIAQTNEASCLCKKARNFIK